MCSSAVSADRKNELIETGSVIESTAAEMPPRVILRLGSRAASFLHRYSEMTTENISEQTFEKTTRRRHRSARSDILYIRVKVISILKSCSEICAMAVFFALRSAMKKPFIQDEREMNGRPTESIRSRCDAPALPSHETDMYGASKKRTAAIGIDDS